MEYFNVRSQEILEGLIPTAKKFITFIQHKFKLNLTHIELKFLIGERGVPFFIGGNNCKGYITDSEFLSMTTKNIDGGYDIKHLEDMVEKYEERMEY